MDRPRTLHLAHSADSDDAFMFHGLLNGLVDTRGLVFKSVVTDIETLNRRAEQGAYEITALSVHAFAYVSRKYRLMRTGASVGDGYGPILVAARPLSPSELKKATVATPGERTTAHLLLRLFDPEVETITVTFDRIIDAVRAGDADVGLLIHEGQVTYMDYGLHKLIDLGEWWYNETGMPVVLGVLAVRRDLDDPTARNAQRAIRDSICYGLKNKTQSLRAASEFSRGMSAGKMRQFVDMYVNDYTIDLGPTGLSSARQMLELAYERGILPAPVPFDLVE